MGVAARNDKKISLATGRSTDLFLTVNAEEILKADERQIEELAKVLRARLDEAMQRLKVRFPVYLVFTNADAIEGISRFVFDVKG